MSRYTIGVDNGSTGSIAILGPDGPFFDLIPAREYLMGRAGKLIKRIDHKELLGLLSARLCSGHGLGSRLNNGCMAYVERPFTGSAMMINTSVLAARSHEAVLIVLEQLGIGVQTVDSREWQVPVLGAVKGSSLLKKASALRGAALYPQFATQIHQHGDADGLLMAHHFHQN